MKKLFIILSPKKARLLHYSLFFFAAALLLLTACEPEDPQVGTGTEQPPIIHVVNNCDKTIIFKVSEDKGSYINEEVQPRSKGGPYKLTDVYNNTLTHDSLEVAILTHQNEFDSVASHLIYFEHILFDPLPQHVFTVLPNYTVEYTLMMANP